MNLKTNRKHFTFYGTGRTSFSYVLSYFTITQDSPPCVVVLFIDYSGCFIFQVWKRWVDNKTPAGTERLNTVVKSILLRRTKEELKAEGGLLGLTSKQVHHIRVELDQEELKVPR